MFSFFRKKKAAAPPPDPALVAEMKEVWFRYGGSSFVIWHEDPEASERFHNAHIPDETIEAWRQEMIESEYTALTEGDPARRWIVARHLLELIGNTNTRTEERYGRLMDLLGEMADDLDKRQRILILQQFADSNVPATMAPSATSTKRPRDSLRRCPTSSASWPTLRSRRLTITPMSRAGQTCRSDTRRPSTVSAKPTHAMSTYRDPSNRKRPRGISVRAKNKITSKRSHNLKHDTYRRYIPPDQFFV